MARIWSDEAKLARWLEVELAALEGWAEIGAVPVDAVREIRERAVAPSPERVAELEARLHHDTAAFVDAVAEDLGPVGRWFHYGLTSSDVVDTALALQIQESGALLLEGVERALAAVVARAEEHKLTLCIGRTHGVHADRAARPARRAARRARGLRVVARQVRPRDPPPRAHRGARGRGAVWPRPEGLVGDAAQAQSRRRRTDLRARASRARRRRGRPRE